mgnify:CR=1 FL=1
MNHVRTTAHNALCSFRLGLQGHLVPRLNVQYLRDMSNQDLYCLIYATIPSSWRMSPQEKAAECHHEVEHIIANHGLCALPAYTRWAIATRLDRLAFRVGRTIYELGYACGIIRRWLTCPRYRVLSLWEHLAIQFNHIKHWWTGMPLRADGMRGVPVPTYNSRIDGDRP